MKNTAHIVLAGAVLVACSSAARAQGPGAAPCERLRSLTLNGARITAAESVAEGAFVPPGPPNAARFADLPAFCRVTALASRAGDNRREDRGLAARRGQVDRRIPAGRQRFRRRDDRLPRDANDRRPRDRHREHQPRTRRRRAVETGRHERRSLPSDGRARQGDRRGVLQPPAGAHVHERMRRVRLSAMR